MKKKISIFSIYSWPIAWCVIGSFSAFLSSCQDYEPFTYSEMTEARVKNEYSNNFIATYGEIDPNQSWDLTTGSSSSTTRATTSTNTYTGVDYHGTLINGRYVLDGYTAGKGIDTHMGSEGDSTTTWIHLPNLSQWLDKNMPEFSNGKISETNYSSNIDKGVYFELENPGHDFVILPIYQGRAACIWDLHLIDISNKKDYKIWTKSQGLLKATNEAEPYNYKVLCDPKDYYKDMNDTKATTIKATSVLSQPIKINSNMLGKEFALALVIRYVNSKNKYNTPVGTYRRSDEGMMIALTEIKADLGLSYFTDHPNDYPLAYNGDLKAMVIGCEDIRHQYGLRGDNNKPDWFGDNDYNDIVFMLVGLPDVPKTEQILNRKRYLCEDLGNTFDFDFNDIVVDVEEYKEYETIITQGTDSYTYQLNELNGGATMQRASIKNMGGTLPFQVTVGNYTFPIVTDPTNQTQTITQLKSDEPTSSGAPTRVAGWDSEIVKDITGWNPTSNNITIRIADSNSRENAEVLTEKFGSSLLKEDDNYHIYKIDFPGDGEVPFIIAVDQSVRWMEEYQNIPEKWWKDGNFTN